jgi:hypothetical protein
MICEIVGGVVRMTTMRAGFPREINPQGKKHFGQGSGPWSVDHKL